VISRRLRFQGREAWIGILSEEALGALRRNGHDAVAGICAPDLPAADVRFIDAAERRALENATDFELVSLYASPFPKRPLVTSTRGGEGQVVTIELTVQPDLCCLRGHFPAIPVVPGATQLGWALEFGAECLGTPPTMRAMRSVKFERIIQPGRSLRLHLAAESGASMLRFEYVSQLGRHSAGRIETRVSNG
jgi:hypothetical protein